MKHLMDPLTIKQYLLQDGIYDFYELKSVMGYRVKNLAVAVLSTLALLRRYQDAIKIISEFEEVIEYFKLDVYLFKLLHANFLY